MKKYVVLILFAAIAGTQVNAQIKALGDKKPAKSPCTTLVGDEMLPGMADTTTGRSVSDNYKTWENGAVLLVKFMNNTGSPAIRERITRYAKEWEKFANIKLNFVPDNTPTTNIRIRLGSRRDKLGHNSAVGIDNDQRAQARQTMNLDTSDFLDHDFFLNDLKTGGPFYKFLVAKGKDMKSYTYPQFYNDVIDFPSPLPRFAEKVAKGTTMHEFGHALGLLHEQSYPGAIKWNKDTVYKYYEQYDWDKAKTDFNVLEISEQFFTNGTAYDPKSIMHYSIPAWQTVDGYSVDENYEMSDGDKKIIAAIYPKDKKISALAVPKVTVSNFVKLEVKKDDVKKALIITPYFNVRTGAKLANAYYVARLTTEDGQYYIATKSLKFNWGGFSGTYLKMNLLPNTKKTYNKLAKKDLQLVLPYKEIPELAGKNFRVEFTVYQNVVATGKLDRFVTYSLSSPLSLVR
ncbi:MAG TPA: M12 family metallopeptidase [Chitinophagaceae bacterium]|nr:M12 family metallopeptidase [Chitinophagaceae bacterium]